MQIDEYKRRFQRTNLKIVKNLNLHHFLRNVLESFVNSLLRRACMVDLYSNPSCVQVFPDSFAIAERCWFDFKIKES